MSSSLFRYSQQAYFNLIALKLRTSLAVLGILVGTAAIVALISCGQLATEKAMAQFKSLGTDLIAVSVIDETSTPLNREENEIPLQMWRQLPSMVSEIQHISPYNSAYQPVRFQGRKLDTSIIGVDESLASIINIHPEKGRFVSSLESFERFCVIGHKLAEQLKQINAHDPLGQRLQIDREIYTIVGITAPCEQNNFFTEDIDAAIMIPIVGMKQINKNNKVTNALILLKTDKNIDAIIEHIQYVINIQRPNLNLYFRSAKQIIASMESQRLIFTLLLSVIGSVSLFVGGIGVMNVMLVSVSERKKEIGIRKAIGARKGEIQSLFLVESVILSLLGGILGVALGLIFTWIVSYFNQWTFKIDVTPVLIGFTVSVVTGVFFGFYPARCASRLEPIVSLRSE
ncbi:MAG: ABC transporter permease [Legionellaceae bacterium]|nr:ABC transporter permease [Legionellaceae bacterium]